MTFHRIPLAAALAAFSLIAIAPGAEAKRIEDACNSSPRSGANGSLCHCIQRVADQTLTSSDQRLAASFFRDPQKAQDVRQSDSQSHEEFWRRYKVFGDTASQVCQ